MTVPLHLASAADNGYFPGLEVLVCSALLHVRRDIEVHFHIFDGGIPDESWARLERHAARFHSLARIHRLPFSPDRFAHLHGMNGNHLNYARLLLGEVLPAVEKIVYLDCDIVVGRDVAELFDRDLQGRTILAVSDTILLKLGDDCPWQITAEEKSLRYFNSGVVVIDLNRWRQQDILRKCMETIGTARGRCHDQTVMNYILRHEVTYIEQYWNQIVFGSYQLPAEPAIIHLITKKPWRIQTSRFDHSIWRAFYEDMIEPGREWAPDSPLAAKIVFHLPRWAVTRWLFSAAMTGLIFCTKQEYKRASYRHMIRQVNSDFGRLEKLRSAWSARCQELGIVRAR